MVPRVKETSLHLNNKIHTDLNMILDEKLFLHSRDDYLSRKGQTSSRNNRTKHHKIFVSVPLTTIFVYHCEYPFNIYISA